MTDMSIDEITQVADLKRQVAELEERIRCLTFENHELKCSRPCLSESGKNSREPVAKNHSENIHRDDHLEIYQNIVSSSRDGIAFLDHDYRYIVVNDAYETFSGIKKEAIVGITIADYLGENIFEQIVKPRFDRCLQGEVVNYQNWFEYQAMGRRYVEVKYFPYRNSREEIVGVIANITDITERWHVEAALRESERKYRDLFEMNRDAITIFTINEDGTPSFFLDMNEAAVSSSGYTKEELASMRPTEFEEELSSDTISQRVHALEKTGHVEFETRIIGKGKINFPAEITAVAIAYKGEPAVMNIARNISKRRSAELALRLSEERFRALATLAPVGIYLTDTKGYCLYTNPRWCEMAGMNSEQSLGGGWADGLHPDDKAMVCAKWQEMTEKNLPWGIEYRFLDDAGRTTLVHGMAAPQYDSLGKITGYVGVNIDITERKDFEESLRSSLREKDALLREVHHRVKNNLAAIIGLLDMKRQVMDEPNGRSVLLELSGRIRSMSLVHEMLYHSESLAKIDFQQYIQSLISHLRTSHGSPEIICEVQARGVSMPLDLAVPCGMIINELITNSLKYAFPPERASGGLVEAARLIVSLSHDKGEFTLMVGDNGVGLPAGFDWWQAKSLGLVLIRMIGQHQLGGNYRLDQTAGTCVTLTFSIDNRSDLHE